MKKPTTIILEIVQDLGVIIKNVIAGIFKGQTKNQFIQFAKITKQSIKQARLSLDSSTNHTIAINSIAIQQLKKTCDSLHQLLPHKEDYFYSILIPTYKPNISYFEILLRSALAQSAPHYEILIGFDGPQDKLLEIKINEILSEADYANKSVRIIHCDRMKNGGGISNTTNELAENAKGNFLLLIDHDDWIRPDLLYRYEQTLYLQENPLNTVLFCNEYLIDEHSNIIPHSFKNKAEKPAFPYLFINTICHALLVPKSLWQKVGGERKECDGAQDYDLCLRLDACNADFQNVPFYLYAWRSHDASTAKSLSSKDYATPAGIKALNNYASIKDLSWEITEGFLPTTYRAKPILTMTPEIHVIVLFKNQKELTLKCVQSILLQKNCKIHITAVDNNSSDASIAKELESMGVEVLKNTEGFNYSRLNNFAVRSSVYYQDETNDNAPIVFLNNDVTLEDDALEEMARWIDQPKVGIVGARLHYPNGTIQHGGVELHPQSPQDEMIWFHTDVTQPFETSGFSRVIRDCPAVTAACCMIKKDIFMQVGGFDEIWYPIAYSDTNLCSKVKELGLYCLYTPYSHGIHYEGASRGIENIEDFEKSSWLHKKSLDKLKVIGA